MLTPEQKQQQQQSRSSTTTLDLSKTDGGIEFGVAALHGYTFNLDVSKREGLEGSALVQSLGSRAMASFPEFSINAAGSPGVDGLRGEHGAPGRNGATGRNGKDGYGPGRPGKPGKSGRDGRPGTAGKKGKKGTNGIKGGQGLNVLMRLSGEGPKSLAVSGHVEQQVVKKNEEQNELSKALKQDGTDLPVAKPILETRPLVIFHRLKTNTSQQPLLELNDPDGIMSESPARVVTDGPRGVVLNFVSQRGVIFVCAHGGRGGNGGSGGNGGYGGNGGSGGNGGKGGDGKRGLKPGFDGENGGNGGDAGASFGGGAGAAGSSGGKGGNAGAGGHITFETTNAKLLMLVEADVRAGLEGMAGKPGSGGEGGQPGRPGICGRGGLGGPPWDRLYLQRQRKYKRYYGCIPGQDGLLGRSGGLIGHNPAPQGSPGDLVADGKEARNGQVTWILKSSTGEIVEMAKDRFNCAVCQFRVRSGSGNGIISPGGTITVDKVVVWNNGSMTLPEGSRLAFAPTGVLTTSSKAQNKVDILPALPKGKRYKSSTIFRLAVEKLDGPSGGSPFQALVSVTPSIELCGRNFFTGDQVLEVPVQYPLQIVGNVHFPHTVHQGSMVSLEINLRNISCRAYGQKERLLGRGEVVVLFFLELEIGQRVEHQWKQELPDIGGGHDEQLQFDCRVDTNGQPYSILSVQVHLLLEGQSIEYRHLESRIVPVYGGEDVDTAVLVTDTAFKPGMYKLWKSILALLGLNCVFWDISWHRSYSVEAVPWLGKHRLVIFTHSQEYKSLGNWLRNVLPEHVNAMGGPQVVDNAGAIFVGPNTKDIARELVDWNNREKVAEVELSGCVTSCWGGWAQEDSMRRVVAKASKMQEKLRAHDPSSQNYTISVSPLQQHDGQAIPLLLFREALPAMFRTRAISVQMMEDPAGVNLLASSPLLSKQEAPIDIYSGISTAIGGLIQRSASAMQEHSQGQPTGGQPIALVGKYITLGLTLAGMIVSLPIKFRVEMLFRFAKHHSTDLPILSSSGITLSEVVGISFYNDLKSDWLSQRDAFPHGQALVTEFVSTVSARGLMNIVELESFITPLTGGLVLLRDELMGFSRRKAKAKHLLKGLLTQLRKSLWETQTMYIPKADKVRTDYSSLQQRLPPWLFSYVDDMQVIRILDDDGPRREK